MTEGIDQRRQVQDYAIENFKNGLNCAECVVDAFMRAGVIERRPEIMALAVGFGGGLGLCGLTCGALSAAIIVNGLVHGRPDPWVVEQETRGAELSEKYYRRYNRLVHDFIDAHGGALCREISSAFEDWHSRERRKHCLKLIGQSALQAYDCLMVSEAESSDWPYGPNMAGLT